MNSSADNMTAQAQAAEFAARMEALAADGQWEELSNLSIELRTVVAQMPLDGRRESLLVLQRSNDILHSMVNRARKDIQGQISSIRLGKSAAKAYGTTDKMSQIA